MEGEGGGQGGRGGRGRVGGGKGERESMGKEKGDEDQGLYEAARGNRPTNTPMYICIEREISDSILRKNKKKTIRNTAFWAPCKAPKRAREIS